jgi:Bacterial Ig-like domain (group 3)
MVAAGLRGRLPQFVSVGDGDFDGAIASTMLTVTVAATATATAVTSSLNPVGPNQSVVYTARVVPNPGSGTVSFTANGVAIAGCPAVPINPLTGAATCSTTYVAVGTHVIGAAYSGDADYAASSAATSGVLALTETVDAAVTVPSTESGIETNPGQPVAGGVLALLGFLTVWGARRRRLRK